MTTFISTMRVYSAADGYANRIPYEAILTVAHLSDSHVYLCAAVGSINKRTWDAAMAQLSAQGVKTIQYERHGRMKTFSLQKEI